MLAQEILKKLKSQANPQNVEGMARFGINPQKTYGIAIPVLRKMAKKIGQDHQLAQQLWDSGIHEARILASMIDEPDKVSEKQMEKWVRDFDSWDVCDQVCMNLFEKVPLASKKINDWSKRKEEFVKRTAYALVACLAWHNQEAPDSFFVKFFPLIKKGATDERNFVKKAVNWALRNIGKKNLALNKKAIAAAREIQKIESKSARWIASDALRELTGAAVQKRLRQKQ